MSSLLAPACKYFICMMMSFVSVVMVMASAGAVLIMFMMMLMLFMACLLYTSHLDTILTCDHSLVEQFDKRLIKIDHTDIAKEFSIES